MADKKNQNKSKSTSKGDILLENLLGLIVREGPIRPFNGLEFKRDKELDDIFVINNSIRSNVIHNEFALPISNLDFENVKSLKNVSINSSKLNIFAGTNSSGKSTILESIALLSKWAYSSNSLYKGIPFGSDFGTMSFDEFKSFDAKDQPVIISMEFDNLYYDEELNYENEDLSENLKKGIIGKVIFTFEMNNLNNEIEDDAKFAPVKKFKIEYINDDESKLIKDFTPVNSYFEFVRDENPAVKDDILFMNKVFCTHVENGENQIDISSSLPIIEDSFITSFHFEKKHYNFETISDLDTDKFSSYLNMDICLKDNGTKKPSRIYGITFDSNTKQIQSLNNESVISGWTPIKKSYLIKWLALDYIMSQKSCKYYIKDFIDEDSDADFIKTIIKVLLKNTKKPKDFGTDFKRDMDNMNKLTMNYFRDMNLVYVGNIFANEALRRKLENTVKKSKQELNYQMNAVMNGFFNDESDKNYLMSWIEGDTSAMTELMDKKQKAFNDLPDGLKKWSETLNNNYKFAFDLIQKISEKSIDNVITEFDKKQNNPMKEIYKIIDTALKGKTIMPLVLEWDVIKYKLIEQLSTNEFNQNTYLAPILSGIEPSIRLLGLDNEQFKPNHFFEHLNKSLYSGFKNTLSTTVFIGPLRERFARDDDIFTFNYPFILGRMGELTGSFLGTFGDEEVNFPSATYIKDKKVETKSYFEHLSDWLRYIGVAEKIQIKDKYIYVSQGNQDIKLENVGVGVSQVLPVLLACMISNIDNELILLEQPELHLHPSAQSNLADFFVAASLSDKKNIFIETHSEHIVNRIKTRKVELDDLDDQKIKIYFASKKGNQTSIQEIGIGSDGEYVVDEYPEGFFDEAQKEAYSLIEKIQKKDRK